MIPRALEQFCAGGAAALALAAIGCGSHALGENLDATTPARTVAAPVTVQTLPVKARCAEDDPCWAWSRMGNRRRGVTLRDGTRRVVGPCGFATLVVGGLVDRAQDPMRGDSWALAHGCANGPAVHPSGVTEVR